MVAYLDGHLGQWVNVKCAHVILKNKIKILQKIKNKTKRFIYLFFS